MKLKPIDEQVVVIFGGSSGIGRETARQFARRGARVMVAARDEVGLASLVEEIEADGGTAAYHVADASQFYQVQAVAERAHALFGQLDTWVHAAAVSIYATAEATTPDEFQQVIEVDLLGQIYGAKAALPHLRQAGGGALIHISSVEGKRALPYQSAYAASKHGVIGFLDALRLELRHEGVPIAVTNVMPSSINTPLFNKARTKLGVQPRGIPPLYEPATVARAILHAAENPTRDIVVGEAGKLLALGQRLAPHLMDELLLRIGFATQRTDEPKPVTAPDNLYQPLLGYDRARGEFSGEALPVSLYNVINRHPVASLIAGAALAGVALVAHDAMGNGSD